MYAHVRPPRPHGRAAFAAVAHAVAVLLVVTSLAATPAASAQPAPSPPAVSVVEMLPLPGDRQDMELHDINDEGLVVGQSGLLPTSWEDGQPRQLQIPGERGLATQVNERGDVIVHYYRNGVVDDAFHLFGDRVTPLGIPEDRALDVVALNERGQVLLARTRQDQTTTYDLWQDGVRTALDLRPPSGMTATVVGLSDEGHVVGEFGMRLALFDIWIWVPTGGVFLWHQGRVTRLTTSSSRATAVNRYGQVIGSDDAGDVLWSGGRATRLPFDATAINDRGQVAGVDDQPRPVLWQNGQVTDLGALPEGWERPQVLDVNERGQVLGASTRPDDGYHAFVWTSGYRVDLGTTFQPSRLAFQRRADYVLNDSGQVSGRWRTWAGTKWVTWTVHDDGDPGPTEPPPTPQCFTTANGDHVAAGRATSWLILTWASGSGTYLGLTSQTSSLREAAPGQWERVTAC